MSGGIGGYTVWLDNNGEWQPEDCATLDEVYDTARIFTAAGFGYRITRDIPEILDNKIRSVAGFQP